MMNFSIDHLIQKFIDIVCEEEVEYRDEKGWKTTRDAAVLTYDAHINDDVIEGLFKHDAAYDNQD